MVIRSSSIVPQSSLHRPDQSRTLLGTCSTIWSLLGSGGSSNCMKSACLSLYTTGRPRGKPKNHPIDHVTGLWTNRSIIDYNKRESAMCTWDWDTRSHVPGPHARVLGRIGLGCTRLRVVHAYGLCFFCRPMCLRSALLRILMGYFLHASHLGSVMGFFQAELRC